MIPVELKSDGSALCRQCGLCCDGTLFNRMGITQAEVPRALKGGLRVFEKDDRLHASQPCSYLQAGGCGIYALRFDTCRGFTCKLLGEVRQNRTEMTVAVNRVAEARRLRQVATDAMIAAGFSGLSSETRAEIINWSATVDPDAKRLMAVAQLKVVAMDAFLAKYFRSERPKDKVRDQI